MRSPISALGSLALAFALVAGCSGDDDATADQAAEPGTTTTAPVDAFCSDAEVLKERLGKLDTGAPPEPEVFREVSDAFAALANRAPEEISADMGALSTALRSLADIFEEVDLGDPDSIATLQEEAAALQARTGDLQAAGSNVQAFLRDECGIELEGAVPEAQAPGGDPDPTTREG